eukprot:jgi/Mesvir1/3529/Mv12002-RA.1
MSSGGSETSAPVTVVDSGLGSMEEAPVNLAGPVCSPGTGAFSCSICMEGIALEDTALVKGCEHAYCDVCILRWAACKDKPTCPQCKTPFDVLLLHKGLDGVVHEVMQQESVCLLLRTVWYLASGPASVQPTLYVPDEPNLADLGLDHSGYARGAHYLGPLAAGRGSGGGSSYRGHYDDYDEDDDYYEEYEERLSHRVLGNRRWGEHGYVRAGRMAARPRPSSGAGSSGGGGDGPGSSQKGKKGKVPLTPAKGSGSGSGGGAAAGAGGSSHGGASRGAAASSSGVNGGAATVGASLLSSSPGGGSGHMSVDRGDSASGVAAGGAVSPAGAAAALPVLGRAAVTGGGVETTPPMGGRRARRKLRRELMDSAEAQAQAVVG